METAIGAARWVVGRALSPITDGALEAWAASSKLGPNIRALKLELLYAQGMLTSAQRRDNVQNPALTELLLELRHLAYAADDVLDELEYFRIQDALDGTYEAVDDAEEEKGLVCGLVFHARHTARAVARKLTCSCAASGSHVDEQEDEVKQGRCCLPAAAVARAVGKRLPCYSLPSVHDDDVVAGGMPANERRSLCGAWSSKAQQRKHAVRAPKLKFDRVEMSNKMTEIIEQLKPVCAKVATILGLESLGYSNSAKTQGADLERRPKTTPEIIEPELYGRQNQKREVVDEIIHGKYRVNDLTVLPIVGPGGIGKTTFTQHIYDEIKSHFQVWVWICVSQNFNANKLTQEIVKQITECNNEKENDSDQEKIEKRIQSKKFLLVLDDMWTYHEDEWKTLLAPFKKGGTKGNMVIVTTRIPKVAEMVELKSCSIKLEHLQHEDSMELFQACVGIKRWKDYHSELKEVGSNIVKRLKGFPLAIKTVGRLLRNQLTLNRWTAVLKSKEWELQGNDDDIMPALKLSYNYLPFHLQQCFSSCALFPEDYRFSRQELTRLWIGLGLLGAGDQNKKIEDIGEGYLNDLVDNGFFEQDGKEHDSPYAIHDLLHDLATNVSSYESLRLYSSDVKSIQIPTSIRHMSIIVDNTYVKDRNTFENYKKDLRTLGKKLKAGNLRTIMLFGEHHGSFYKIFGDILRDAKSLRVIFLSGASYNVEDLLYNFSRLVHLRYLRIKESNLPNAILPNNISRLYHLLVLDVQDYHGQWGFIRDMGNLLKLRHFLVPNNSIHSSIPEVGKLRFLRELRRFEVKRETKGFELAQIEQLVDLQGSLGIYNLERVEEIKEADGANLACLNCLDGLTLAWDKNRCNKDPVREGKILESLKPHSNLRELHISGHGGATCPKWLGVDFSIRNLKSLLLEDVNWDSLPLPGMLYMSEGEERHGCVTSHSFHINLKRLELVSIPKLKKWRGNGTCNLLPYLQNLTISDCPELIELPLSHSTSSQFQQSMIHFPEIKNISISNCPKLLPFPPIPWTHSLCQVSIKKALDFEWLDYKKDEQSESALSMKRKDAREGMFCDVLDFNNLTELQELYIENCPPISLDHLKMLTFLKALYIGKSSNILLPVDSESNVQCKLPVETLNLSSCGASGRELTQMLSHFPKLSKLSIWNCQNVAGVGVVEQQAMATAASGDERLLLLPPQLQELTIRGFQEQSLYCSNSVDRGETAAIELQGLPSLQTLSIIDCPKLLCSSLQTSLQRLQLWDVEGMATLPPPPLLNLTDLVIYRCGNLRGGQVLHALLVQGHLTNLQVTETPNFFLGSESWVDEQDDVRHCSKLQVLRTDDFAGVLATTICRLIASSLTDLDFHDNDDVECFTKEQDEALQILTSIQDLEILRCNKLLFLPAGLNQLPNLKALQIRDCRAISSLGSLPDSLQTLGISFCPAIHSLPKDGLPGSLREIYVRYCQNEELNRQRHKIKGTIPVVIAKGP